MRTKARTVARNKVIFELGKQLGETLFMLNEKLERKAMYMRRYSKTHLQEVGKSLTELLISEGKRAWKVKVRVMNR